MNKQILDAYKEYWTQRINNIDYSDIDCFVEDNELSEEDQEELLCKKFIVELKEEKK